MRGYTNDIIAERAGRFVRATDERPFFLLVGLTATHSPWRGHPERLASRYRDASFRNIPAGESYPFGEQALESMSVDRRHEREAQVQYYAAVSHVDEIVGQLLEAVDEAGKLNNTLVVYTSDHGLNCGHHGLWGKGNATLPLNMLEESIRVPLQLSWPGVFLQEGVASKWLITWIFFRRWLRLGKQTYPPVPNTQAQACCPCCSSQK